nr:RNA 2',3'-cyclic phosphodiesterase [Actinomycetales bacterium]
MRMFVAVRPSSDVIEELVEFLEPRDGMSWTRPENWHLTLAFMDRVPDHRVDELVERLGTAAGRVPPFLARLTGAGAFPDPSRASVLWLGVNPEAVEPLGRLAVGARAAANKSGATPDGKPFRAHLTLARPAGGRDATKWLRVLDTFYSSSWEVDEIHLIQSFLGEGPRRSARHEVVARLSLGG